MLKSLFGKTTSIPLTKLPQLHSFVDVIAGGRPARQVTVESVGPKGIVTRESLGKPGEVAVIVYAAPAGRFRAQTKIAAVANATTTFEMPRKVSLIGAATGAQKRQSVRLDAIVSGHWRFAPSGVGTGEWAKCTIRDISRGGCSLIIDRGLKHHVHVEVRMQLRPEGQPLTLLGEVMRHEVIKTSGKHSHGLRFQGIRPDEDQGIVEFINRRQAELRSRGLA
ncbi:MAG TPA: PilZ domain-containing protein [Candidatus Aquilonibacter sp.]|nr:PilZ domain-containing protein [Candidatus Aquilonibacter sp.]